MYAVRILNDYLPPEIGAIEEIKQINNAIQPEIRQLWERIFELRKEFAVETSTDEGLSRWEKALGFARDSSATNERRKRIQAALQDPGIYTMLTLRQSLAAICGEDGFILEFENQKMSVKVALATRRMLSAAKAFIERTVPANIALDVTLAYNTHEMLSGFTQAQLSEYSHTGLRENVFEEE